MNLDDVIYLALLFFSIGFGYYYRGIGDKNLKKNVGTAVGILIIFVVSGFHIIHSIVTILVNAVIILYIPKKKCHLVSFAFSFLYLLFFRSTYYFGIPYPPAHTNLVQMVLTLKLVGLAFEINSTYNAKKTSAKTNEERLEIEANRVENVNFVDIIHYSFNYIGVLTGPYYRYRTFVDYFNQPFSDYADYKNATIDKIKYVPLFAGLFLLASYNWPISYATSDEFYTRSWLYRYWYIWPNFFIFRMRIYTGLVLSECVCTLSGLGAYPDFTNPKPGQGPSENFNRMRQLDSENSKSTTYNFETIRNVNPYGADFCTTYREAMKHWNICIQYWLAVNVYKRFPNRKYRTVVTMLVSAFWHGVYLGYYVCIATAPIALALENVWVKVLKDKEDSIIVQWVHWLVRMHFFSYQAIAFMLLEVRLILHYYNSIYHAGLIFGVALYVVGLQLLKNRRKSGSKDE